MFRYFAISSAVALIFWLSAVFLFPKTDNQTKAIVLLPTPSPTPFVYVPEVADEEDLWTEVNDWKYKEAGYTYSKSAILCEYADIRVEQIKTDWSHSGFKAISDSRGFYRLGENLSNNLDTEYVILQSWLNSPTHKANLDENFTHSCIRCEDNYCVHLFGKY